MQKLAILATCVWLIPVATPVVFALEAQLTGAVACTYWYMTRTGKNDMVGFVNGDICINLSITDLRLFPTLATNNAFKKTLQRV